MIKEFEGYRGIKVLNFFLESPDSELHIKDLARRLDLSPATSKRFCDLFSKDGIFISEKKGNAIFFRLDNSSRYVRLLKRTYSLMRIKEIFPKKVDEGLRSVVVYGSYASGDYTDSSDLDILLIGRTKNVGDFVVSGIQKKIKREVNVVRMSYVEWEKLKRARDVFSGEVLGNNFVVYGEDI